MINILNYLRKRYGLTQKGLAAATQLTANDISRFENGRFPGINKVITLAEYFEVTVDALLSNNAEEVFATFKEAIPPCHNLQDRIKENRELCDDIGRRGEDWVYQQEVRKLQGTVYANAVNPGYADDTESGFDILSFGKDGSSIFIEVKTTTGKANNNFVLSTGELKKARECLAIGERYEIHRVYYLDKKCGRIIIPVKELFDNYTFETDSYKVKRKKVS